MHTTFTIVLLSAFSARVHVVGKMSQYCIAMPCRRSPNRYRRVGDSIIVSGTRVVAVPPRVAAARMTGKPAYDIDFPECMGKCKLGVCITRFKHPGCCFVRSDDDNYVRSGHDDDEYMRSGDDEYDVPRGDRSHHGRPYAAEAEQAVAVSSLGTGGAGIGTAGGSLSGQV